MFEFDDNPRPRRQVEDDIADERATRGAERLKQVAVYYYPHQLIPLDEQLSRVNSKTRAYDGLKINRSTYLRICGEVMLELMNDPDFAKSLLERLYEEKELAQRLKDKLHDLLDLQKAYKEGQLVPRLRDL